MDQDKVVYIVVDRVGAPYRVLLCQPYTRFSLGTNSKVSSLQHWGGSLQNRLRDEQTCETTLASAYVLRCLSAVWSQLQMKERKSKWE